MSESNISPTDGPEVIVVGFGPVGATLALLLAKHGRRVTIIERQASPYGLPRAVHIDDGAARVLQAAGIATILAANSHATTVYEWRNAVGITLLRLASDAESAEGWPSSNMIHQPTIEAALSDAVNESPLISVCRNRTVVEVTQSDSIVSVVSVDPQGQRFTHTAPYLVGCDGANSIVRAQMNVQSIDLGFFFDWLIVDVVLNDHREFDPENLQVCDPARPTTAVSGGPGRRRWEFMCLPGEDPAAMNEAATAWKLLSAWDVRPDNARLERHAVYRFQAMWVEQWRTGRILLAGDAAHLMPPFAGQGLCSGLKDVRNLAWKLDHVLQNPHGDALLDSYQTERAPAVKGAIELSVELGKIICVPDPEAARERDEAMAPGAANAASIPPPPPPIMSVGLIDSAFALAGQTFPQAMLPDAKRSDDEFGFGWKLFGRSGIRAHLETEQVDASIAVIDTGVAGHCADTISAFLTDRGVVAVLVRPDAVIFGAVAHLSEVTELVAAQRTGLDPAHLS
jgi:2-polyprenyl-6-methoxyphenol hydroxylase-like FAD-dependent oxidoreductase